MVLTALGITIQDIYEAKQRLAGKIYRSGMPRSNYLSELCQGQIFLKFENMQRTGSFKIRGAYNKLSSLLPHEAAQGVVACSAGNHAQGVALSCTMLGINAKIVMPTTAPKAKIAATTEYGAEVILFGENFNETMQKVDEIIAQEQRIFIHPFDDVQVIAGQGTIGLEIFEDLVDVDNVIVPIGGGGLIAGIALALKSLNPHIRILGVQAENVHGMYTSFKARRRLSYRRSATVADGCDVDLPGELNYAIVRDYVDDIVLVSDAEIKQSMGTLIQRNKIVTEGAGALATAALLSGKVDAFIKGKKTVNIISGGNIDLLKISQIIDEIVQAY